MKKTIPFVTLGSLLLATPALAHITLAQTEGQAGSSFRGILVVGHGCEGNPTTAVRVQIPDGLYNVKPMPKPGWELETAIGPYETAFDNHGTQMTEGVTEITWSGGNLPDDQFDEFTFRGTFGSNLEPGAVYFPVLQQCGDQEDAWIDTSGEEDAEFPAPAVVVGPASGEHSH
jgi:uncharacterized protein YcnI